MKTVTIPKWQLNKARLETLYDHFDKYVGYELVKAPASFVPGRGNYNPRIVFIGEAPGEEEDKQGKPFVGPSGKFLDNMVNMAEIDPDSYYITNLLKYRPPGNKFPEQDQDYILASAAFVRMELGILNPRVVVCLGRHAAALFFQQFSISQIAGQLYVKNDRAVVPNFHPSYMLRQRKMLSEKDYDNLVAQFVGGLIAAKEASARPRGYTGLKHRPLKKAE